MPAFINVCKVGFFGSLLMIVEIKYEKPAGPIGKKRIHTYNIGAVFLVSQKMKHDSSGFQGLPVSVLAFITILLLAMLFRAYRIIPPVSALWEISAFPAAFGIDVHPSPEHGEIPSDHFFCNIRSDYSRFLIFVVFFPGLNVILKYFITIKGDVCLFEALLESQVLM